MQAQDQIPLTGIGEPSGREVRSRVSADLRSKRRTVEAKRPSAAHGIEVLERAQKRYKNNPKAQMTLGKTT